MNIHCTLTQCDTEYTTIVYYDTDTNTIYLYYPHYERNKSSDKYKQYIPAYCNWLKEHGAENLARDILLLYNHIRDINNGYDYWSSHNHNIEMYPSYDDDFPLCEWFIRPQDIPICSSTIIL